MCSAKFALASLGTAFLLTISLASSATYSIPAEKVDPNKVYYGVTSSFEKPGEVDYEEIVKATPEYQEVKDSKIEAGTGKYWILMSQATDRACKAIAAVGESSDYDLIAASGYLGKLEPAIPAENITDLVKKEIGGEDETPAKSKSDKTEKPLKTARASKNVDRSSK